MHSKQTSKIEFIVDVSIELLFVFLDSLPLILCMEIQCSLNQQERLAQLLSEIFGEKLSLCNLDKEKTLPSPNDLRGKIIIKVKMIVR